MIKNGVPGQSELLHKGKSDELIICKTNHCYEALLLVHLPLLILLPVRK